MHGSIRKAKEGGWVADVRVNGLRRQLKAGTKKEAEMLFSETVQALLAGKQTVKRQRRKVAGNRFTMSQARELALQVRWQHQAQIKEATTNSKQIVSWFGEHFPIEDITPVMIHELRQHWSKAGNQNETINRKLTALRGMIGVAAEHSLILSKPVLPRDLPVKKPFKRAMTDEEIELILGRMDENGCGYMVEALVFQLDTCSRWGDLQKLRGEDVNLDRRTVTFRLPKNGEVRTVPLSERAYEIVKRYLPANPKKEVFGFSYNEIEWRFRLAKRQVGLGDDKTISMHSLRHAAASRMVASKVPDSMAMKFGGWNDRRSFARYTHLSIDDLIDCAALVSGIATHVSCVGDGGQG